MSSEEGKKEKESGDEERGEERTDLDDVRREENEVKEVDWVRENEGEEEI